MIDVRVPRLRFLILLPVALVALGLLVETRGAFPLLRYAVTRAPEHAPSMLGLPAHEIARGVSTVSLYVRPDDLYDPQRGLLANRRKHGLDWERPGWISFVEDGRLVHSSGVGVRIHGGSSRETKRPQGFRVYFRRRFGGTPLPGVVAFGPSHAHQLRRLIIHNDLRIARNGVRWHLSNPLAYDIAAAVGAIVAPTRPVRFVLNGVFQDVFVLTEHFDARDYFEAHRGYPVRMDAVEFERLWRQVRAIRPLRMQPVGQLVDLDNLIRWFIASVFCATIDAYQGPGQYRDPMRASAQWFWVNWDMDGSFREPEQDSFDRLLSRTGRRRARRPNDPRPLILTTLLDEDAEFRAYFQRVWADVMNHVLTPEFLNERYEHYRAEATRLDLQDRGYLVHLRQFLDRRPAVVWQIAERWLGTGPSPRVRIGGTRGAVVIDGRRASAGWEGTYFRGMSASVAVPPDLAYAFSHWVVNGAEVRDATLTLAVNEPLDIEPIWARGAPLPPVP